MNDEYFKEIGRIMKEIDKNVQPIIKVTSSFYGNFQPIINAANEISKAIQPAIEATTAISKTIEPLVKYIAENSSNIENFINSLEKISHEISFDSDIPTEEMIDNLEKLENENKIYIDENWNIKLTDTTIEKPVKDTTKRKISLVGMASIVGVAIQVLQFFSTAQTSNITVFDNSTNITENNYYINVEETTHNKTVVNSDNVKLYIDPSDETEVIHTLNTGDKVTGLIDENEYTLVIIENDNNEIENTGWIKSKFLNNDN